MFPTLILDFVPVTVPKILGQIQPEKLSPRQPPQPALFDSLDAAVDEAIRHQVRRRNLTPAEIYRLVEMLDKRKQAARPTEKISIY